jgi:AcrR family transcriptional regulator
LSTSTTTGVKVRGGNAVKAALIDAAADMLGEVGPRTLSVRDVADRAGVNHGQVHHYFGGKRGLLRAAMSALATEHWTNAERRADGGPIPPALSLAEDRRYWRATCRAVLEGDLELARVEIDEGHSVPRRAMETIRKAAPKDIDEVALKADFALGVASQLGWVAFEDFAFMLADVGDDERESVRDAVRRKIHKMVNALIDQDEGSE